MKIRQFGVIVHQRLVHLQHLERLPEEVRFEENRPCIDTRFSEHGEETVVFLLVETDGVPVHRRDQVWDFSRFAFSFSLFSYYFDLAD